MSDRNIQISFKVEQNRQMQVLNNLLEEGFEPDVEGKPVLIWLAEKGHTELVKKLKAIRKSNGFYSYLTFSNKTLGKALYMASKNGHTQIVEMLIKPILKNYANRKKQVAKNKRWYILDKDEKKIFDEIFYVAVNNGHTEILKLLLELQKKLYEDYKALSLNDLLVKLATIKGHTQMVKELVNAGINVKSRYIQEALKIAAKYKHSEIERILKNA